MTTDAVRTPDDRFDALPGWPFAPRYADHDGLRMAYVDEGEGEPVLLLHGEPTWSYLYRRMIPPLSEPTRVVAPDYLGFGRSDKPTDRGWYSYDAHYHALERLVVDHLDLRGVTVVCQDWGGPLGLRLAAEHGERVARIVVMNTGVGVGAPSESWLRFRELMRRVDADIVPSRLVRASCAREVADDVLAAYDAPFPSRESLAGVVAFPELVPTEPEHVNAAAMLAVRDRVARWTKPALVLFGDSDPIFSPLHAERMAALIPGAGPPQIVPNAGHMLQEDAGEEVAARILAWLGRL